MYSELKEKEKQIEELNNELNKLKSVKSTDNIPHQTYRALDRVLFALVKLTNKDNSEPTSQNHPSLNAAITTLLDQVGLPLNYQSVGKWLSRAKDLEKEVIKKTNL